MKRDFPARASPQPPAADAMAGAGRWALPVLLAGALGLPGGAAGEIVIRSHGISAFGDLKYGPDFRHFDYVNPDAPKGGTFSSRGTGASKTFDSLNPFILKGEPAQGLGLLYDSLLVRSADEPDSSYGYVAEALEYPEDRQWVIFDMRPEATFADGHPITAADVVFTFNVLLEKGHPAYAITYKDFESVEALGPHRVKFTFREGAQTRDLPAVAGDMDILPEHYYETVDFAESTLDPPLGSGAYEVAEVAPGKTVEYCRVPDYWGASHPASVGADNFDCYVYEYFSDSTAAFEALKAGEYLFHEEYFSKIWATEYDFPALGKGWVVKESLPDGRPSGTQGFWINMRRDKFADVRIRKALGLLFNFEWSNKTLFYGLYTRTDSFWENSGLQASGMAQGAERALLERHRALLPPEVFSEPAWTPPVSRPDRSDRKALRAASKLLDEAGWTLRDGLRRNAAGETLEVEILDDSPAFERIVNPYVENLRRAGIDARYSLVDPAQMQQRQEDFDYDVIPGRLVMSLTPGEELATIFGSRGAATPGTLNLAGVAHPGVDALIVEAAKAKTREALNVAVRALDRVLRALHVWVPNWYKAAHNVAYWDVFGRPAVKPPYSRGVLALWWFDREKYDRLEAEGAL